MHRKENVRSGREEELLQEQEQGNKHPPILSLRIHSNKERPLQCWPSLFLIQSGCSSAYQADNESRATCSQRCLHKSGLFKHNEVFMDESRWSNAAGMPERRPKDAGLGIHGIANLTPHNNPQTRTI